MRAPRIRLERLQRRAQQRPARNMAQERMREAERRAMPEIEATMQEHFGDRWPVLKAELEAHFAAGLPIHPGPWAHHPDGFGDYRVWATAVREAVARHLEDLGGLR